METLNPPPPWIVVKTGLVSLIRHQVELAETHASNIPAPAVAKIVPPAATHAARPDRRNRMDVADYFLLVES